MRTILRLRWIILLIGLSVATVIELVEGALDNLYLLSEPVLSAIAIPFIAWLLLTALARNIRQRIKSETRLLQYQEFVHQLIQRQDWDELTRFVTHFPSTLLPVDRTALFIYDHRNARLEFAGEWPNAHEAALLTPADLSYASCQNCLLVRSSPKLRSAAACAVTLDARDGRRREEFCLPYAYNNMLVGVLRLRCQPGQTLSQDQIDFMNASTPEVAVALALAISYPRQIAQVRTEAQSDERRYIAYVLHNTLAQQIGYLHFNLDRLTEADQLRGMSGVLTELQNMRRVAGEAYERIRNTVTLLRSDQHSDLTQAIVYQARTLAQSAKLQFDFTTQGDPRPLAPQACEHIVSLLQEGLNNVVKHAGAQHVHITLDWLANSLNMTIGDDGMGFDSTAVPESGHYGLTMMCERVRAMGGLFVIDSTPGLGTRLIFTFPLDRLLEKPRRPSVLTPPSAPG